MQAFCDACDCEVAVSSKSGGKRVRCPECGQAVRISDANVPKRTSTKTKKRRKQQANPLQLGLLIAAGAVVLVVAVGIGLWSLMSPGNSTPEGAILALEAAYRAKDMEAAVKCKDFRTEGRLMLQSLPKLKSDEIDDELISKTAEVLELAFRKEMEQNGFPNMAGITSTFPKTEPYQDGIVLVTELCVYPDGGKSEQKLLVSKSGNGWRVLNVLDDRPNLFQMKRPRR